MNQQILDYINQSRQTGATDEQIQQALSASGWSEQDIQAAMDSGIVSNNLTSSTTASVEDQQAFINRWSWGGFGLGWLYFMASRMYKTGFLYLLGLFIPILNIYLSIKSGFRGRKMTWESGKWADFGAYQKRQKLLDTIAIILIVISIITSAGYYAYSTFFNKSKEQTNNVILSESPKPSLSAQISAAHQSLNKLNEAAAKKDTETYKLYLTRSSIELFSTPDTRLQTITINYTKEYPEGNNVVIVGSYTDEEGNQVNGEFVFVNEGGLWKWDMSASFERDAKKLDDAISANTGGKIAIESLDITPNSFSSFAQPINLKITVKNTGQKLLTVFGYKISFVGRSVTKLVSSDLINLRPNSTFILTEDYFNKLLNRPDACKFIPIKAGTYQIKVQVSLGDPNGPYLDEKTASFTLTQDCKSN